MKRLLPVLALAFLSPFIAEVLFGATPLSRISSFPALLLLYGGGAVTIRELARRTARPWMAILCLGAAYGLLEEGVVMQTLFSPDLFGAAACGARWGGVNWVWTEALLGYHAVWSIAIPIALVELCFPGRRDKPWLGRTGMAVAMACYGLGAVSIGIVFRHIVTPTFRAPLPLLLAAAITAAVLVARGLGGKAMGAHERPGRSFTKVPSLWIAGAVTLAAAGLWMELFHLPQALRNGLWPILPMALAAYLAGSTYLLFRIWAGAGWTDLHRLAAIGGGLLASAAYGADVIKEASAFDRWGQAGCSVLFFALLAIWARCLRGGRPIAEVSPLK